MITIIYGPRASGKTHHSAAFRRRYQCHAAIDLHDFCKGVEIQRSGLLILTDEAPETAELIVRRLDPLTDIRLIPIRTARIAIGEQPVAPPLPPKAKS
ncbi:MAG: hypothetical protein U9R77_07610 [Pseudomonadota bacterium]|nr:hypothetical protein [Pseudomonadota bacterium]